jgi:hypothetical protein
MSSRSVDEIREGKLKVQATYARKRDGYRIDHANLLAFIANERPEYFRLMQKYEELEVEVEQLRSELN